MTNLASPTAIFRGAPGGVDCDRRDVAVVSDSHARPGGLRMASGSMERRVRTASPGGACLPGKPIV